MLNSDRDSNFHDRAGLACLLLGAAGILLFVLDVLHVLPWEIARIWLHSPSLLLLASLILLIFGCWLTWRSGHATAHWRPQRAGKRFQSVLLYTRQGCSLCDEAAAILAEHREFLPPIVEVDIDSDPALVERFGNCVPVVEIDGQVRFRANVSRVLLRRLIEATPPYGDSRQYSLLPRSGAHGDRSTPAP